MLAEGTVKAQSPNPATVDVSKLPKLFLDYIEIEGPLIEQWPPESYQRLLKGVDLQQGTLDDAARSLRAFVPRAFRRPVTTPSDFEESIG